MAESCDACRTLRVVADGEEGRIDCFSAHFYACYLIPTVAQGTGRWLCKDYRLSVGRRVLWRGRATLEQSAPRDWMTQHPRIEQLIWTPARKCHIRLVSHSCLLYILRPHTALCLRPPHVRSFPSSANAPVMGAQESYDVEDAKIDSEKSEDKSLEELEGQKPTHEKFTYVSSSFLATLQMGLWSCPRSAPGRSFYRSLTSYEVIDGFVCPSSQRTQRRRGHLLKMRT